MTPASTRSALQVLSLLAIYFSGPLSADSQELSEEEIRGKVLVTGEPTDSRFNVLSAVEVRVRFENRFTDRDFVLTSARGEIQGRAASIRGRQAKAMWSEDSNQQTTLQAGGTSTVVLHFEAAKHWSWSSLLSFTPENTKVSAIVTFAPASDTTNGIDKDVAPVGIHLEPPLWLLLAGAVFGSAAATIGFLVYPRLAQLLGLPIPAFLQRPPVANWKKIATDSLIIFTAFSVLSCAIILLSVPFSQSSSWISFAILDVRGAVLVGLGGLALSRRLANYLNDTADLRPRPLDVPAPEVQPES